MSKDRQAGFKRRAEILNKGPAQAKFCALVYHSAYQSCCVVWKAQTQGTLGVIRLDQMEDKAEATTGMKIEGNPGKASAGEGEP